ncbi:glycine cleavage system protein H [Mycolicibacterium komossense]|uniref:Glycine cleavage system H protein n=1 Tax=Mycolicibacterium komossense TaxID=1779 RepID=A0ABT3CH76_9MYCO|nr:glycine cleavage system H protein [Mycolicibacterium komossense]MCV7228812.1 glycine cleavage system protein H [Mycolicibacterium komossense]
MTAELPTDRLYTEDHEWVLVTSAGDLDTDRPVRIGITRLAAENLGELVYLDLPEVGASVTVGEACGEVESTKTVSELFPPVSGRVAEINQTAVDDPAIVSADPYGRGWLFTVAPTTPGELLSAADYAEKNGING